MRLFKNARCSRIAATAALTLCVGASLALALPYIKGAISSNELAQYRAGEPAQDAENTIFSITDKQNPETPEHEDKPTRNSLLNIDWNGLTSINPAVIGWIYVPGSNIDHAIVQANENNPQYYLSHDVFKRESLYGCPYLDADSHEEGGLKAPFPIIYGHHLIHGQMFSDFAKYSNPEYAESHSKIIIETPEESINLKVIAVNVVNANKELLQTRFQSSEDLSSYMNARLAESEVILDTPPDNFYEQVFCFVTCSYGSENERTLVYAVPQ